MRRRGKTPGDLRTFQEHDQIEEGGRRFFEKLVEFLVKLMVISSPILPHAVCAAGASRVRLANIFVKLTFFLFLVAFARSACSRSFVSEAGTDLCKGIGFSKTLCSFHVVCVQPGPLVLKAGRDLREDKALQFSKAHRTSTCLSII